jgi:LmbE family N-acetylglucosaminyl deacetylase
MTMPIVRSLPTRLLGVWAHPDDECYLSAGLMARVADAGGAVRILCATSGELGTDDAEFAGTERFARMRREELAASLGELGVHDLHVLGLPDGGCAAAADPPMIDAIEGHIDSFRPDAVVTFGPDGITGHDDHRAVSRWATDAVRTTEVELLYATMTRHFVRQHRALHDALGLFELLPGGRPHSVRTDAVALEVSLAHDELLRKRRALARHGSQTEQLAAILGEDDYLTWWRDECFRHPTSIERAGISMLGAGATDGRQPGRDFARTNEVAPSGASSSGDAVVGHQLALRRSGSKASSGPKATTRSPGRGTTS